MQKIPSKLYTIGSEKLTKQVEKELEIPDPVDGTQVVAENMVGFPLPSGEINHET